MPPCQCPTAAIFAAGHTPVSPCSLRFTIPSQQPSLYFHSLNYQGEFSLHHQKLFLLDSDRLSVCFAGGFWGVGNEGISLEREILPKTGPAQLSLSQWLHPGWERHRAVWGGSNRCLNKAFSLEAFLGDKALSGSFKSRQCQIQRGRKSAILQLSASVSESKFAYWSWDLQNDSLQRLNSSPLAPRPRILYLFLFVCFGFIFSNILQFNGQAGGSFPAAPGRD